MKKFIASTVAAGLVAGTTIAASAATPVAREGAPVAQTEEFGGSSILLVLLAAAAAVAAVVAIESGEDEDVPTSP